MVGERQLTRGYAYLMPATGTVSLEDTYQSARADFEKVLSLDPDNEEAVKGLYYTISVMPITTRTEIWITR